jgi:hypothetical protein
MKLQVTTQELFLLAKNAWSAKHILARVRKGELQKDKVLFGSDKAAYQRRSSLPLAKQRVIDIFKVKWTTSEVITGPSVKDA